MSCVYCDPKSTMRIFSEWISTRTSGAAPTWTWTWSWTPASAASIRPVVRRFLLDDDVVHVALAQAGGGDPHEARLLAELLDRLAAEVAHAAAEPAGELEERHLDGPLVRDPPLDPLGHELVGVRDVRLEVTVLRALLHRAERAHAPVRLVAAPLVEDDLARRLLRAREARADHDRRRARGERLHDVAGELHAAVRDDRDAVLLRRAGAVVHRGDLRDADAGDDARRADGAGPDAALHRVDARLAERLGRLERRDVPRDDLDVLEVLLRGADRVDDAAAVPVRRVDRDDVHPRLEERLDPGLPVDADADGGAAQKPAERVLRGVRVLLDLLDVLDRDEPLQLEGVVHDEQLLDAVGVKEVLRLVDRHPDAGGDEVPRHHLLDALLEVLLEAQVAVREDADEPAPLDHRDAADPVLAHEAHRAVDRGVRLDRHRVGHDGGLELLDLHDLRRLLLDRQILVDEPEPAGGRHGDRHARLGHRVHRGGHDRDVDLDVAGEPGRRLDRLRQHVRFGREKQDVVERERQSQVVAIEHADVYATPRWTVKARLPARPSVWDDGRRWRDRTTSGAASARPSGCC